ncbi:hypothetical protein BD779DRAFT_944186 [Infundibulicybe gibba]|nr:hypothetical protein BD779DRAFT_944186 [Infundibulicybe gibba]
MSRSSVTSGKSCKPQLEQVKLQVFKKNYDSVRNKGKEIHIRARPNGIVRSSFTLAGRLANTPVIISNTPSHSSIFYHG